MLAASLALGGCLLITPLDDFENAPDTSAGMSGSGGSSGDAGAGFGGVPNGEGGTVDGIAGEGGRQTGGESGRIGGEAGAPTAGSAGAAASGCRTNSECITAAVGEAARCRPDGRCVALKSGACPLAYGKFENDNAIYIGAFGPLPEDDPSRLVSIRVMDFAREEFSGNVERGLPGPDGERHPIVMVVCNSSTEALVLDGMDHLANEVGVPAVLATIQPGHMLSAFDEFEEHEIFYLNPGGATRNVVKLDDDDLVWNLLGQPSDLAPVYAELVRGLETYIRAERAFPDTQPLRVAHVTTSDAFNTELSVFVGQELEINGELASDNDMANYRLFSVLLDDSDPDRTATAIGNAVREFQPDLVISTANEAFTRGALERIELAWRESHGDAPRPYYVLSPFNAGDMDAVKALITAVLGLGPSGIETDPFANLRFVGIEAAGAVDKSLQRDYETRFGAAGIDKGNFYDAFYYLAYAMYAAGPGPDLTGPAIRVGFQRLLAGPSFEVGPRPIPDVFDELEPKNSSIELIGTLGPPDFDLNGGVRIDTGSVFCIERNGDTLNKVVDALRYDRTSREFDGEFPCFDGFPPP